MVGPVDKLAVGAHYGSRDWLAQRVTAIVIALYTLLIALIVLWHGGLDYPTWTALFAGTAFRAVSFVFVASLLLHAWIGVRNILMDYVKPTGLRLALEIVVVCVLIAYVGWTIEILWGHA